MTSIHPKPKKTKLIFNHVNQNGAAILITMFALFFTCSLLIMSSVKSVKSYTNIIRNQFSNDKSFTAAESGINFGLAYLRQNSSSILVDNVGRGNIDEYKNSSIKNVKNDMNTTFNISYSNPIRNNFNIIEIKSTGQYLNGSAKSTIIMLAAKAYGSILTPQASFITKGNASLGGNLTIANTENNKTIWSGGAVNLTGSASTKGTDGITSNKKQTHDDVLANDSFLSDLSKDKFFKTMLGKDKDTISASASLTINNNTSQNISSILSKQSNGGNIIWVNQNSGTASLSGNTTIGSNEKPVVLIINGNFKANGRTEIYGIVYVTQNWHNSGGGNLTIHGAVIVEGDFSGTGTPSVTYDSKVFANLDQGTDFEQIAGSWRDF